MTSNQVVGFKKRNPINNKQRQGINSIKNHNREDIDDTEESISVRN